MADRFAVVTGATGHIGGRVAAALLARGYRLTILVRRLSEETARFAEQGAKVHVCDLMSPATYRSTLVGQDVLFHLAAENTTDTNDDGRVVMATAGLTKAVVGAALSALVPTSIYTSSVVVLGRGTDGRRLLNEHDTTEAAETPYVRGKLLAEQWIAGKVADGADVRRVYPSWVVGPGDPAMTPPHRFISRFIAKGQLFHFGGGVSIAHVDDVALGHVLAYEKGSPAGQYVLSGDNVTFEELYATLAHEFGQRAPVVKVPKWCMHAAARVLGRWSPVPASYIEAVVGRYSWYDHSHARQTLGYQPRPLAATIAHRHRDIRARVARTIHLRDRKTPAPADSGAQGPLLITGFPGWLGNRMVDILMNGDAAGRNKTARHVRLLVQPHLVDVVPSLPENYEVIEGDVTDRDSLRRATQGVSAVWHAAGVIYPSKRGLFDAVNVQGTRNVADVCIENGVQRILYMSTDSCCGFTRDGTVFSAEQAPRPYKEYGRSKYSGEEYLMSLTAQGKLKATSLRGFWFFGPDVPDRNLGFLRSFFWPFQPVFGNGRNRRSISHCDDIVNAFCLAEDAPSSVGRWYWLPTFLEPQTVDEIYRMIGDGLTRPPRLVHIPDIACDVLDWVDSIFTRFLGVLHPTIHAAGKFHRTIATDAAGAAAARRDFGWEPAVTVEQIQHEISESVMRELNK